MTDDPIPVLTPDQLSGGDFTESTIIWGVVLAAGTSQRFGTANKLLAEYRGAPVVEHAVETVVHSGVDGVSVVTGHEDERVRAALEDHAVEYIENCAYSSGQSTSVRAAVRAARGHDADAVLIMLGDMPAVAVQSLDLLIDAYHSDIADILIAAVDHTRGNPVLFDRRMFDKLTTVDGDIGGRGLFETNTTVAVETNDKGVRKDIDHPEDLASGM